MESISLFAERLKEVRTKRGMKQAELAEEVGVSTQTISAYEKGGTIGKGKNPTLENAIRIAQTLNVSLDWLCGINVQAGGDRAGRTLGDIARSLVDMGCWDTVCFEQIVKKEYTETDGFAIEADRICPAILFRYGEMAVFVSDWMKIYDLHDKGTIDRDLYSRWVDSAILKLDGIPCDTQTVLGQLMDQDK